MKVIQKDSVPVKNEYIRISKDFVFKWGDDSVEICIRTHNDTGCLA
jgi:hypothetical protein